MLTSLILLVVSTPLHSIAQLPMESADISAVYQQGYCLEYVDEALQTGWESQEILQLTKIMYRESRCDPLACGIPDRPDLRHCRDWGLMQVNDHSWKTTIRSMGLEMEDMWDPWWNLFFARLLFDKAEAAYGCGWQPWNIPCKENG